MSSFVALVNTIIGLALPGHVVSSALLGIVVLASLFISLARAKAGGRPKFPGKIRVIATVVGVTSLLLGTLLLVRHNATPRITAIFPQIPIAGDLLEISGSGFGSDGNNLRVMFDDITSPDVRVTSPERIDVRVPTGAKRGPLRIEPRSRLLSIVGGTSTFEIKHVRRGVLLRLESLSPSENKLQMDFSVSNAFDTTVALSHVALIVRRTRPTGPPHLQGNRVDLGEFQVLGSVPPTERSLEGGEPLILDTTFDLPPGTTKSFRSTLVAQKDAASAAFSFSLSANYYRDDGEEGKVDAPQVDDVTYDPAKGFAVTSVLVARGIP